jgi:hypothetical protein
MLRSALMQAHETGGPYGRTGVIWPFANRPLMAAFDPKQALALMKEGRSARSQTPSSLR